MDEARELRALIAMQRYYLGEISFQRVAYEAGISIHELLELVNKYDLRIISSDEDVVEGLRRLSEVLESKGIKSVLRYAKELSA